MSIGNLNRIILQTLIRSHSVPNFTRFYGRWMHRKPAKVLLPFEPTSNVNLKTENVIELRPDHQKQLSDSHSKQSTDRRKTVAHNMNESEPITKEGKAVIMNKREEKLKKRKFYLSQLKVFDDNNEILFEKCKDGDGRISMLFTNLKNKKGRLRNQQILVEGWRLVVDGLEARCNLKYVIFSRMEDLNNLRPFLPKTGVKFFKIPYKEIELWSDVETSPGVFGIFEMPTEENIKRISKPLPLNLICDNIRVPGNLGAILRAAVGAGCEKVLLSKGCVDAWDPKVVRSAAGAHFRLPIHYAVEWDDMPRHLEENTSLFVADSNARIDDDLEHPEIFQNSQLPVLPYYGVEYSTLKHVTLIIGGETEGISEESYRLAASLNGVRLNVPMARGVDSLNTGMATAIIAFEIRKQLIQAWSRRKLEKQVLQKT